MNVLGLPTLLLLGLRVVGGCKGESCGHMSEMGSYIFMLGVCTIVAGLNLAMQVAFSTY